MNAKSNTAPRAIALIAAVFTTVMLFQFVASLAGPASAVAPVISAAVEHASHAATPGRHVTARIAQAAAESVRR